MLSCPPNPNQLHKSIVPGLAEQLPCHMALMTGRTSSPTTNSIKHTITLDRAVQCPSSAPNHLFEIETEHISFWGLYSYSLQYLGLPYRIHNVCTARSVLSTFTAYPFSNSETSLGSLNACTATSLTG